MMEVLQTNPFLFWSFVFFLSFGVFSLTISTGRRFFTKKIDGGKVPVHSRLIFEALKECHFGNYNLYLKKLRELARRYPEETEFFLMAGDIVRKTSAQKALEIHRDLLFRSGTTGKLRAKVLKHTGEDYLALGKNLKAVNALKESVKIEDDFKTHLLLSKAYERSGAYDQSIEEVKRSVKLSDEPANEKPVKNLISRIVIKILESDEKENGVKYINELKKYCSKPEAQLLSLKNALIEGKQKKAASVLKEIVESVPDLEVAARGLLTGYEWGKSINSSIEGRYRKLFDESLKNKKAVCSECGKFSDLTSPVCDSCFKPCGKKVYDLLEE